MTHLFHGGTSLQKSVAGEMGFGIHKIHEQILRVPHSSSL